ncbi:hypothetical protein [Clostridium sp.]|uniref:hypothetical protein n=1 Tax=Clostridium sp. TaxID=1506 RepID=UPI0026035C67|nr:hypothetical protein [Clostridium sp.]
MENNKRFEFNGFEIRSNYGDKWIKNSMENPNDFIWINNDKSDQQLELSLKEAEFIANSLQQLINYIKSNTPQIHSKVKIIKGKFEGYEGKIIDIDTCDKDRPLAIEIHNKDINGTVYVNYNDVEKIN